MSNAAPMGVPPAAMAKPAQPNAITRNMSGLNPADVAMNAQTGKISKDMSMRQFLETTYKLPVDAPFTQWLPVLKQDVQNRNAVGKGQSIASQQGAPTARPMPSPAPAPAPKGVEGLMGMMGGK